MQSPPASPFPSPSSQIIAFLKDGARSILWFFSNRLVIDLGQIVVNNFTILKAAQKCPRTAEQDNHSTRTLELLRKFNHEQSSGDIICANISGISAYISVCTDISKSLELLQQIDIRIVVDHLKVDGSNTDFSFGGKEKGYEAKQILVITVSTWCLLYSKASLV